MPMQMLRINLYSATPHCNALYLVHFLCLNSSCLYCMTPHPHCYHGWLQESQHLTQREACTSWLVTNHVRALAQKDGLDGSDSILGNLDTDNYEPVIDVGLDSKSSSRCWVEDMAIQNTCVYHTRKQSRGRRCQLVEREPFSRCAVRSRCRVVEWVPALFSWGAMMLSSLPSKIKLSLPELFWD